MTRLPGNASCPGGDRPIRLRMRADLGASTLAVPVRVLSGAAVPVAESVSVPAVPPAFSVVTAPPSPGFTAEIGAEGGGAEV